VLAKNPTGPVTVPRCVVVRFADVTDYEELYLTLPKCRITKIWAVLGATFDSNTGLITTYKNAVAITDGVIEFEHEGSAAGDIEFCQPTAHNEFNGLNDYLKLISGGEAFETAPVLVTVEYEMI